MLVELRKMFGRRRTWLAFGLLNLLPTIVAGLLAWTGIAPRPGQGPAFLSAVSANGSLFAIAALAIVLPLFLPVAVAVAAGDTWRARPRRERSGTCWSGRLAVPGCSCGSSSQCRCSWSSLS